MEAYITLTEVVGNRWELTVRLPNKWLTQFSGVTSKRILGGQLGDNWGGAVVEDGAVQPWRSKQHVYCSLANAEEAATEVLEELDRARQMLKPKGYVKYTIDLTTDGPMIAQRDGNQPADKEPF